MEERFSYLKSNPIIVETLKQQCIIGELFIESANAMFYISKKNSGNLIKVFNCHNSKDIIDRKNDFLNEIEVLKCLQETLKDGITQINDSNHNSFLVYYEMPKYKIYDKNKNVESILKDFKYLFDVLKSIHSSGYIHLDIKPDNIMSDKGKPVIIDFGCAQKLSGNIKLPKGPKWFAPPELLNRSVSDYDLQQNIDYKKSDIYMMSKTLWAVLQNGMYERGFFGDYNRNYLQDIKKKINVNCEPINILFENTIITNWEKRLNIEDCINLLNDQIKILNDDYHKSDINYDLLERLHDENPNILVYEDCNMIEKIVEKIKKLQVIRISDGIVILDSNIYDFNKELLNPLAEKHFVFKYENKSINIAVNRINVYKVSKNQLEITIELDDVNGFKDKFTLLPQFSAMETVTSGTYYLDSKYKIIVEPSYDYEKRSIDSLFK